MASIEQPGLNAAIWFLQQAGFAATVSVGEIVTITAICLDGRRFETSGKDTETALRNMLVVADFNKE